MKSTYSWLLDKKRKLKKITEDINLKRNADAVLLKLEETLSEHFFFFSCGTLLGIYRDNDYIKYVGDIDVFLYISISDIERFTDYMSSKGFFHKHRYILSEAGIVLDSFEYLKVSIDIIYIRRKGDKDYYYLPYEKNIVMKYEFTSVEQTRKINFHEMFITVPQNIELFLEETYGGSWHIRDSTYIYWENKNATKEYQEFVLLKAGAIRKY